MQTFMTLHWSGDTQRLWTCPECMSTISCRCSVCVCYLCMRCASGCCNLILSCCLLYKVIAIPSHCWFCAVYCTCRHVYFQTYHTNTHTRTNTCNPQDDTEVAMMNVESARLAKRCTGTFMEQNPGQLKLVAGAIGRCAQGKA